MTKRQKVTKMNKCRIFLDKDERFAWSTELSDHWLKLANEMTVENQEQMNIYGWLYDSSDQLLYSAAKEKARLDGVISW